MSLIQFTDKGLYCPAGDFYIDPWRGVDRAVITHAHSDHARWGSRHYLAHRLSRGMLKQRLGQDISLQLTEWGKPLSWNGISVTLYPAGHIMGSSMVLVEGEGEKWLITGDYKTEDDGISGSFAPVPCTHMVTECTFGLPIYQWRPQEEVYADMRDWVIRNVAEKRCSVFYAYSLGKAQRLMHALQPLGIPMFAHGAVYQANQALASDGIALPEVRLIDGTLPREQLRSAIVIAPPSAAGSHWLKKLGPVADASCSGWMQVRGNRRRNNVDAGFVLSDHADWPSLLSAITACGPEKVYATHGFTAAFSRYLNEEKGIWSDVVSTQYGNEDDDSSEPKNGEDAT